jgi:hypothetical protein
MHRTLPKGINIDCVKGEDAKSISTPILDQSAMLLLRVRKQITENFIYRGKRARWWSDSNICSPMRQG